MKNYLTVSRILIGACLLLMIISWLVTEPIAHSILRWMLRGFAASYVIVVVLYYAKPGLYNNKTKEEPH